MSCYICGAKDNDIVLDYNHSDCKICKQCNSHKNALIKTKGAVTHETAIAVDYFSNILKERNASAEIYEIVGQWNSAMNVGSACQTVIQGDRMQEFYSQGNGVMNNREVEYLLSEQLTVLRSIKSMLTFFVVLTVIGLVAGVLALS